MELFLGVAIQKLLKGQKKIMAKLDELNAEVAAMTTSISAAISAETAAITAALANDDSAGVAAAVANLKTAQATLDTFTASITPPAPAPTT